MSVRLCVHKCDTRHTEGGEKIALKKKESHNLFHQYNDEFVSLLYLVSNNKKDKQFRPGSLTREHEDGDKT